MKLKNKYKIAAMAGMTLMSASSIATAGTVTGAINSRPTQLTTGAIDIAFTSVELIVDRTNSSIKLTGRAKAPVGSSIGTSNRFDILTATLVNSDGNPGTLPGLSNAVVNFNMPGWTPNISTTSIVGNPMIAWGYNTSTSMGSDGVTFLLTTYVNGIRNDMSIVFNFNGLNGMFQSTNTVSGASVPTLSGLTFEENARSAMSHTVDVRFVPSTPTPTAAAGAFGLAGIQILRRRRDGSVLK